MHNYASIKGNSGFLNFVFWDLEISSAAVTFVDEIKTWRVYCKVGKR